MHPETQYLNILSRALGSPQRDTRNDNGSRSFFGASMEFDMADGFPLLTTKRVPFKHVALELDWFLSGNTNAKWLQDRGVTIWDEWCDEEDGELGPIYGAQFRSQESVVIDHEDSLAWVDPLCDVVSSLKADPHGRRHVISLWDAPSIEYMALPPCHGIAIQFYVEHDGRLSLSMYQRSADVFLGLPFNIASYSLMLHYVAHAVGRVAGRFLWFGGDVHLYSNHIGAAIEQLSRHPRKFPEISIDGEFDLVPTYDNVSLSGYDPHPTIKAEVSA